MDPARLPADLVVEHLGFEGRLVGAGLKPALSPQVAYAFVDKLITLAVYPSLIVKEVGLLGAGQRPSQSRSSSASTPSTPSSR